MVNETMTVHAALCERKVLEKRISRAIEEIEPVATKESCAVKVNGHTVDSFSKAAKENEQRALDLIKRLNALKSAINQYNANAKITVNGTEYTIAGAIWLMQYGMGYKKKLLEKYAEALRVAESQLARKNADLDNAAEKAAAIALGGKDKGMGDEYLTMVENYKERHQYVFVDPLGIKKRIQDLSDEITAFESEVDAKIQSSNAMTEITITY